jgi:hypothetical protein
MPVAANLCLLDTAGMLLKQLVLFVMHSHSSGSLLCWCSGWSAAACGVLGGDVI